MSVAMGTRLHILIYIYKTTSMPILVLLSQNAQSYPLAAVLISDDSLANITSLVDAII